MGIQFTYGHDINIGRRVTRVGALLTAMMLRELVDGPCTVEELRDVTGLSPTTIRDYLKHLIKQRLVHIAGRVPNSRGELRVLQYRWAPDKPHARPRVKTIAERSRDARERRKQRERLAALNRIQLNPSEAVPCGTVEA